MTRANARRSYARHEDEPRTGRTTDVLKTECVYWEDFATRQAALQAIHAWIEVEYHLCRTHSGIGYATPAEFENEFALASRAMNE